MCYMPKFEDLRRFTMVEVMQKYGYMPKLALTWVYRSLFEFPPPLLCHMQGFVVCETQNFISGLIDCKSWSELAVKGEPQAVRSTLDSKLAHDSVVIKQKWKREVRRSHLFLMIICDFAMQILSAGILGRFLGFSTMLDFDLGI